MYVGESAHVLVRDVFSVFLCQAEDGIRDLVRSRGLGDVYKRQTVNRWLTALIIPRMAGVSSCSTV